MANKPMQKDTSRIKIPIIEDDAAGRGAFVEFLSKT